MLKLFMTGNTNYRAMVLVLKKFDESMSVGSNVVRDSHTRNSMIK
jgi:hypothetical protein